MPRLVGGVAGIVALAAGIFGHVDAIICLERALVALVVGCILGSILQSILGAPVEYKAIKPQEDGVESGNSAKSDKVAA